MVVVEHVVSFETAVPSKFLATNDTLILLILGVFHCMIVHVGFVKCRVGAELASVGTTRIVRTLLDCIKHVIVLSDI